MAQSVFIPVPNDTTVPTRYYETLYNIVGNPNQTQKISNSPLPLLEIASPWAEVPYVEISPLPDGTDFQFMMRRWDLVGNFSDWVTGNFSTP